MDLSIYDAMIMCYVTFRFEISKLQKTALNMCTLLFYRNIVIAELGMIRRMFCFCCPNFVEHKLFSHVMVDITLFLFSRSCKMHEMQVCPWQLTIWYCCLLCRIIILPLTVHLYLLCSDKCTRLFWHLFQY